MRRFHKRVWYSLPGVATTPIAIFAEGVVVFTATTENGSCGQHEGAKNEESAGSHGLGNLRFGIGELRLDLIARYYAKHQKTKGMELTIEQR